MCLFSSPRFTKQPFCRFEDGPDVFSMIILLTLAEKMWVSHRYLAEKKKGFEKRSPGSSADRRKEAHKLGNRMVVNQTLGLM